MWSKLEEVFEEMELPYFRQGSLEGSEEFPSDFFTFWNNDTPEDGFYDNVAHSAVWYWYVYFYTNQPENLYTKIEQFIKLAKEKGFVVEGKGRDIASGEPDYLGRYVRIKYVEKYNSQEELP